MRIIDNNTKFIGRKKEFTFLEAKYNSLHGELIAMTGRRRIGKSALVKEFANNKKMLRFEGLEDGQTRTQIDYFTDCLKKQIGEPVLEHVHFKSWNTVFQYLTTRLPDNGKKVILFFDELQWMAAGHNSLISIIKAFWDNEWKNKKVLIILCGSIASFMMENVIRSKALYGRITGEMHLKGLEPTESIQMFSNKRGFEEILKYLLVFGGVPKYLEMIDLNRAFGTNINELCFSTNAIMLDEFGKIFYSQFKKHHLYQKIVRLLKDKALSLHDLSQQLGIVSSGGLQRYVRLLEDAEFIRSFVSFGQPANTKFKKYRLADEFIWFYFYFIHPHLRTIRESRSPKIFELVSQKKWDVWCGFAFERFCIKHAHHLAHVMGFADDVLSAAPFFGRSDKQFQIDLIFHRANKVVTLCEVKYNQNPIDAKVVAEVEQKVKLFDLPKGHTLEKSLIHVGDVSQAVRDTNYFHHLVNIREIF